MTKLTQLAQCELPNVSNSTDKPGGPYLKRHIYYTIQNLSLLTLLRAPSRQFLFQPGFEAHDNLQV